MAEEEKLKKKPRRKKTKFTQTHFDWSTIGYVVISKKGQEHGNI